MKIRVRDQISKMIKLLSKHWCKYSEAKDMHGYHVNPESSDAVSFCVLGAKHKIGLNNKTWDGINKLCQRKHHKGAVTFNDLQNTVKPVIKLLQDYKKTYCH